MTPFNPNELSKLVADRERFGSYVYTPLDEVLDTWKRRQPGRFSPARTETAIGATIPEILRGSGPVGILCRQVATPNYETRRVIRLAAQRGIRLIIWEYYADRFVMENRDKYALGRLGFYGGLGRNGGRRLEYVRIFDVDGLNGTPFNEIKTFRGESLIDFHHRLLHADCPQLGPDNLFDGTEWFSRHGGSARNYYPAFISLFLRDAILFETFVLQGHECDFTRDIFLPVYQSLYESTGLKPMIVPAEREDWEGDDFWHLYPEPLRGQLGPYRVRDQVAVDTGLQWETPADRETQHTPLVGARAKVIALDSGTRRRNRLAGAKEP